LTYFAITHEVGAANLLYPYLMAEFPETLCISTGPSEHLPSQHRLIGIQPSDVPSYLSPSANTIFLGASPLNLELTVIPTLKKLEKVPCQKILVLDNWVNYESRLNGLNPDSVIVFDDYAQEHASRIFCDSPGGVVQVRNYFLEGCSKRYQEKVKSEGRILFIEVPLNKFTSYTNTNGDSYCICNQLLAICERFQNRQILYRRHPSGMGVDCFTRFGIKFPHFADRIELSENFDLLDDFANSEFVVGLPSYALFLAQKLGVKVFVAEGTNEEWHGPLFESLSSIL
jgi:hypothetical protein